LLRDRDGAYGQKFRETAKLDGPVEPPSLGHVIQIPKVGGLHHLYTRKLPDRLTSLMSGQLSFS
jgi:hypothetical protein